MKKKLRLIVQVDAEFDSVEAYKSAIGWLDVDVTTNVETEGYCDLTPKTVEIVELIDTFKA